MGMAIAMILLLLLLLFVFPNDIERRLFCILGVNGAAEEEEDMDDEGDMDDEDDDVIASTSLRTLSSIVYRSLRLSINSLYLMRTKRTMSVL